MRKMLSFQYYLEVKNILTYFELSHRPSLHQVIELWVLHLLW